MLVRQTITILLFIAVICCQAPMQSKSSEKPSDKTNINELIDQLAASDTCIAHKAFMNIYRKGDQAIPILLAFGNDRTLCHLMVPQSKFLSVISNEHTRGILCLYLIESIRSHRTVHGGCYPTKKYNTDDPNWVRDAVKNQKQDIQLVALKAYRQWYDAFKSGQANNGPEILWDGACGLTNEDAKKEMFLLNCDKDNREQ